MDNLRLRRRALGMTQAQLGKIVGVSQSLICVFEQEGQGMTMEKLLLIAECLRTSVDYLLERTDVAEPYPPGGGGNLRALRQGRHLTQFGLQMHTGIDQSKVSKYERGEALPTAQNAAILADFFHTSTDFILDRTPVRAPHPRSQGEAEATRLPNGE